MWTQVRNIKAWHGPRGKYHAVNQSSSIVTFLHHMLCDFSCDCCVGRPTHTPFSAKFLLKGFFLFQLHSSHSTIPAVQFSRPLEASSSRLALLHYSLPPLGGGKAQFYIADGGLLGLADVLETSWISYASRQSQGPKPTPNHALTGFGLYSIWFSSVLTSMYLEVRTWAGFRNLLGNIHESGMILPNLGHMPTAADKDIGLPSGQKTPKASNSGHEDIPSLSSL